MAEIDVTMSEAALEAIRAALPEGTTAVRLTVSETFEHDLSFATPDDSDVTVAFDGVLLVVASTDAARARGVSIDYGDGPQGAGFMIRNPHQPPGIVQLSALELKAMRDRSEQFELVDVRTEEERALAAIDGARLLDREYHQELLRLDRATPLVFQCHHGVRSQAAAEYFLQAGFTKVYNLRGGIDAWSMLVDAKVRRY